MEKISPYYYFNIFISNLEINDVKKENISYNKQIENHNLFKKIYTKSGILKVLEPSGFFFDLYI